MDSRHCLGTRQSVAPVSTRNRPSHVLSGSARFRTTARYVCRSHLGTVLLCPCAFLVRDSTLGSQPNAPTLDSPTSPLYHIRLCYEPPSPLPPSRHLDRRTRHKACPLRAQKPDHRRHFFRPPRPTQGYRPHNPFLLLVGQRPETLRYPRPGLRHYHPRHHRIHRDPPRAQVLRQLVRKSDDTQPSPPRTAASPLTAPSPRTPPSPKLMTG